MKYFFDTEFIEGFHGTYSNGNKAHTIQLVSIGIYCENGMSFYAISNEFNPDDADQWVKDNVLSKLSPSFQLEKMQVESAEESWTIYDDKNTGHVISIPSSDYPSKEAAIEVAKRYMQTSGILHLSLAEIKEELLKWIDRCESSDKKPGKIKFYSYFADYDWVVFCSLFGRMIDLPNGFPMFCIDLKQMFDAIPVSCGVGRSNLDYFEDSDRFFKPEMEKHVRVRFEWVNEKSWPSGVKFIEDKSGDFLLEENEIESFDPLKINFKKHYQYPPQVKEHNAMYDALWNYHLYQFIVKRNFKVEIESDFNESVIGRKDNIHHIDIDTFFGQDHNYKIIK